MRAVTNHKPSTHAAQRYDPVAVTVVKTPVPADAHVLVRIHAAALNHRDVYIRQGLYPKITFDSVLGSDASGVVVDPNGCTKWRRGDKVLVNPARGWISDARVPESGGDIRILGLGADQGTFAEFISVHEDDLAPMPAHLSFAQGAALPLAGLTAYRAVVSLGNCKAGDVVLIPGIGGGVALFALQLALSLGATVYVTSSSPEKLAKAKALGAAGGALYTSKTWASEIEAQIGRSSAVTLVVDGVAGPDNLKTYMRLCAPGATICVYGAVAGSVGQINFPHLWFKHLTLRGVCMGSRREFHELVALVDHAKTVPVVDFVTEEGLTLAAVEAAFDQMKNGRQFGKIVIDGIAGGSEESPKL
ncbi:hypothetical protein HDU83_001291 [Entophlyctis luteolus]|nr:hypothetical protein HDU83_001291 [Entophlyctis luteolus]